MAFSNGNNANLIVEAHEDRIQRLETNLPEVAMQVNACLVKLDYTNQNINQQGERVSEKLDSIVEVIAAQHKATDESIAKLAKQVSENTPRIGALERVNFEKAKQWAWIRKLSTPLLIAGGGVLATKLGELLWVWLSR